jgi:hypothetical protein
MLFNPQGSPGRTPIDGKPAVVVAVYNPLAFGGQIRCA